MSCGLRNVQVLDADFERPQKFQILAGDFKLGVLIFGDTRSLIRGIPTWLFVESNRRFQNQENIVAGILDVLNRVIDSRRLRERVINSGAKFLDQVFQIVVKLQLAPFIRGQGVTPSYAYRRNLVNSQIRLF